MNKAKEKLEYFQSLMKNLDISKDEKRILYIFIQNGLFDNTPLSKTNLIEIISQEQKISLTKLNELLKNLTDKNKLPIFDRFEGHKKVFYLDMDLFEQYCQS